MKYLSSLLILIIVTGCATIMRGTKEEVEFTSEADSVEVWISGEKIGYTPISKKLGKMRKVDVMYVFPDGQTYSYRLKTKISPVMLYNLSLGFNPPLILAGCGIDFLTGAGRTFNHEKQGNNDYKTEVILPVRSRSVPLKPEAYLLISGGLGYTVLGESGNKHDLLTKDLYAEMMVSPREIIDFGIGQNLSYFKEKEKTSVTTTATYFVFQAAPGQENTKRKAFILTHLGYGIIFTDYEEGETSGKDYFYLALGIGLNFNRIIQTKFLLKGYLFTGSSKMPSESISFSIGYMFNLSRKIEKVKD